MKPRIVKITLTVKTDEPVRVLRSLQGVYAQSTAHPQGLVRLEQTERPKVDVIRGGKG